MVSDAGETISDRLTLPVIEIYVGTDRGLYLNSLQRRMKSLMSYATHWRSAAVVKWKN